MPATPFLGGRGAGDANVAVDMVQGNSAPAEMELLGRGIHPGDTLLDLATGADVAVSLCHARSMRLSNSSLRKSKMIYPCSIPPVCSTLLPRGRPGLDRPDEPHGHAPSHLRIRPGQQGRRRRPETWKTNWGFWPTTEFGKTSFSSDVGGGRTMNRHPVGWNLMSQRPIRGYHRRRFPGPVQPELRGRRADSGGVDRAGHWHRTAVREKMDTS